jgi:hypothetical protein
LKRLRKILEKTCDRKSFHRRGGGRELGEQDNAVAAPVMKTFDVLNRQVNFGYGD